MQKGASVQGSGACYWRYYEKHGEQVIRRTKYLGYVKDYPTKTSILPGNGMTVLGGSQIWHERPSVRWEVEKLKLDALRPEQLGVWSLPEHCWASKVDLTEPTDAIMPWRDWIVSF